MGANHDDLVLQIGARYLGDRVVTLKIVVVKLRFKIDRHFHRHALFDEADEPIVLFDLGDELRDRGRCILRGDAKTGRRAEPAGPGGKLAPITRIVPASTRNPESMSTAAPSSK